MNHNEIEACVIRAKSGSEEDFGKLMKQFRPFIYKTANNSNIRSYDIEDLVQLGNIALMKAVLKYKIGSHTFSSYAFNSIKNEIRCAARINAKIGNELSINAPVHNADSQEVEYVDFLEDPDNLEEDLIKRESFKELKKAIERLSDEEIEFVNLTYFKGVPLRKYAEDKGIEHNKAIARKRKVIQKLGIYLRRSL
ncbi:sigma-70 family RNA polymerase sigma factor [Clostridium swellfunianum]|uniref:sigma-70 family RNA polymerase sigma factor n=1 Tax=Clostridium swellfunianum TaxID=1367462 RepID=UPI002030B949|nr:sigma-70 family RNA polymerase sigma factor [Clostridium swellfunianum]MCM0648171.1 sigma-70 family RNA polymerase sigma factor [Clostridium swellfunianum]